MYTLCLTSLTDSFDDRTVSMTFDLMIALPHVVVLVRLSIHVHFNMGLSPRDS